jgi:hypothetical protein
MILIFGSVIFEQVDYCFLLLRSTFGYGRNKVIFNLKIVKKFE